MEGCKLTKDIIYVTSNERATNYKWEKTVDKLNPNVQIVSIDDIQEMGVDIFDGKLPVLDTILVKHPFVPNKYIPIDRAEDAITKTKLNCLGIIVRLLGAKEYETKFMTEETGTCSIGAGGEIKYMFSGAQSNVSINESDSMTGKYYRHETFKGEFTEDTYKQAVVEAKRYGLYDDEDIIYLLKNRDPQFVNQIISQCVKFELTKELNNQLDIAFSLKVSNIFNLSANYNQIISKRKKIIIETKILFE